MHQNWWSKMEPAQRRKVAFGGVGLLFITGPAIFATWWYMFSSTPPYQWFRENGFPTMNFPLLLLSIPIAIGFAILGAVLWSIRRENTIGMPEYSELLRKLVERKQQKSDVASGENSGGYSTLQLISQQYRNRPPQPKPELQGRIISVGIRGIAGGTGITVYMRIDNLGTPSCADHFVASVKTGDATYELFPAELPAKATYADNTGRIRDITRAHTLYEILRNPIVEGGHALGFLFYFAKELSAAQLTAANPPEIVIRFRDVRRREYIVTSEGQEPSYPPGVHDPFVALPITESAFPTASSILQVTFDNSDCIIVRVINHDPDRDAKIKSVAVFGINIYGEEKQILSTKVPNSPNAIPGGWRLGSISFPYRLAPRDAQNFETLILECNLSVNAHAGYFAEVTLQTGETVRSEVAPVTPRETNPLRPIDIRDKLDAFIASGNLVLGRWKGDNDALLTDEIEKESLRWLSEVTTFAKKHLSLAQVDKLKDFKMTLTPQERHPVAYRLVAAGMDPETFYVAYEMGYKLKILEKFRDEIR